MDRPPDLFSYVNSRLRLNKPDTAVPMLNKPESKPLTVGPRMPGTPVLKKPELNLFCTVPPLAVFPKPEINPGWGPVAVLKKPDIPVPVLLKPELGRPLLVVAPKALFTLPEFQKPVFESPEFPLPVLTLPEFQKPVFSPPAFPSPVLASPAFPKPVLKLPAFPKPTAQTYRG